MQRSSSRLLTKFLKQHNLTPEQFAQIAGMPESEVIGIMNGKLPVTTLRANHFAAAFGTSTEMWLKGNNRTADQKSSSPKAAI